MNKKIILIGEKKSLNLGDSIICKTAEYLFQCYTEKSKIAIYDISIARRPESVISTKIKQIIGNKLFLFKKYLYWYTYYYYLVRIKRNDCVCIIGGALIQDFFAEALTAIIDICRFKHASLHFTGVGIGPLSSQNMQIIKSALLKTKLLDLKMRDGANLFSDINIKQFEIIPDIALCCPLLYRNESKKGQCIGWGVISPKMYNKHNITNGIPEEFYLKECIKAISILQSFGEKIVIFCNGDKGDFDMSQKIYNALENKNGISLFLRPLNDSNLINFYQNFKYVISSRLHSLIIAFAYQIPSIALSWDNKVDAFVNYYNGCMDIFDLAKMNTINWQTEYNKLKSFSCNDDKLALLQSHIKNNIKHIIQENDTQDNTLLLVKQ